MTTIKLPPLPESFPAGYIAQTEYFYTAKQLRARDLEVARVVLEAAATWYNDEGRELCRSDVAAELRTLEVKHE